MLNKREPLHMHLCSVVDPKLNKVKEKEVRLESIFLNVRATCHHPWKSQQAYTGLGAQHHLTLRHLLEMKTPGSHPKLAEEKFAQESLGDFAALPYLTWTMGLQMYLSFQ